MSWKCATTMHMVGTLLQEKGSQKYFNKDYIGVHNVLSPKESLTIKCEP